METDSGKAGSVMHPVRVAFQTSLSAPRPGVLVDLVYYEPDGDTPEYWTLRLYRENLGTLGFSTQDMLVVHNWISDIMKNLRSVEAAQRGASAENGRVWLEIFDKLPKGVQ